MTFCMDMSVIPRICEICEAENYCREKEIEWDSETCRLLVWHYITKLDCDGEPGHLDDPKLKGP